MKTVFLSAAILLTSFITANSQTVNDIPLKDIDVEYVQIVGSEKPFTNKMVVEIDFGQEHRAFSDKDTRIKDERGKSLTFNSMIDALNFMVKNNYEFVQAYAMVTSSKHTNHYLLRRRKL